MFNASNAVRLLFFNISAMVMIGIWLTGFGAVHWFSYVLPAAMLFAAVTGFCPGLFVSKKILGVFGVQE